MINVLTAQTMTQLEKKAFDSGISEQEMMEIAGKGVASYTVEFIRFHQLPKKVLLLCGKGNNAGDAFVAGRYLLEDQFEVTALQKESMDQTSPLCQLNAKRYLEKGGKIVSDFPSNFYPSVLLDGLFGTGFRGEVGQPYADIIAKANRSAIPILAIDIPSGLNGTTGEVGGIAIRAVETIYLGLPKSGFFLNDGWNYVGRLRHVSLGIPDSFLSGVETEFYLVTPIAAASLLPKIKRNRYKYQTGSVAGWAGSKSMPGAALLASLASLRGGCGLTKLLYPEGMESELASSPYEVIKIPYTSKQSDELIQVCNKSKAVFIGPGLGVAEELIQLLHAVIPNLSVPCVIDADALNAYAKQPYKLPKDVVMTPHSGELERLMGQGFSFKRTINCLKECQTFSEKINAVLIIKGAPTFILAPHCPILVNPTGSPGMATAGSGDVLTGLIAALLAQGLTERDAALLAVYLHGLAGEFAEWSRHTCRGMIASDLIHSFPQVYAYLEGMQAQPRLANLS